MIPAVTTVRLTGASHRSELPLLVLGPSLGTSATTLWSACAQGLTDAFDVVAWDLPGHGHNRAVHDEPFTMAELAAGVLRVVDAVLEQRGDAGGSFGYAGDSVGGAVGLQLMLDAPARVTAAVLLCTGAQIGDDAMWSGRIEQVRASGTPAMVTGSAERWFGPGFVEREPDRASALLHALQDADDAGYAQVCGALAAFDVRDRLHEVTAPVLAVAGATTSRHRPTSSARSPTGSRTVGWSSSTGSPISRRPNSRSSWPGSSVITCWGSRSTLPTTGRTAPCVRSTTPASPYAARSSATPTSTGRPLRRPT